MMWGGALFEVNLEANTRLGSRDSREVSDIPKVVAENVMKFSLETAQHIRQAGRLCCRTGRQLSGVSGVSVSVGQCGSGRN